MLRNVLDFYILRASAGDSLYRERLLRRLSERLLFVPYRKESQSTDSSSAKAEMDVIVIPGEKYLMVPAFTLESIARNWVSKNCPSSGIASRTGFEISSELASGQGLILNPGHDHSVTLSPNEAKKISALSNSLDIEQVQEMPELSQAVSLSEVPLVFKNRPHITLVS